MDTKIYLLFIVNYLWYTLSNAFKPVILMHGLLGGPSQMTTLVSNIKKVLFHVISLKTQKPRSK